MPNVVAQKDNCIKIATERLAVIDRLLTEGMRIGPASKRRAINKVLRDFPELSRGDCWQRIRQLRQAPEVANLQALQGCGESSSAKAEARRRPAPRPWTEADDDKLLNWAGYEGVDKIARRLNRSERAIRYRLCAFGMSAKVTDGWSLRALQRMLRVSTTRLRQFIAGGLLRVRDPRITANSLVEFCNRSRTSLGPSAVERIARATSKKRNAYQWEPAADLLAVAVAQVQSWIADGQLKVLDTFVSDRSFEEFCEKHGAEINIALIDPATRKWLIEEYGVPPSRDCETVARAQKHVLVVRTCKCGRKIAGNAYFRHAKACKVVAEKTSKATYESSTCGKAFGGST